MKPTHKLHAWIFLIWALIFTWTFWIPAGFFSVDRHPMLVSVFHYVGGAVPFLLTISVLSFYSPKEIRIDYLQRLFDLKRISRKWWIIIIFSIPFLVSLSALLSTRMGVIGLDLRPLLSLSQKPLSLFSLFLFTLIFGPIPEELAWRGYALDGFEKHYSPFLSSLILGIFWIIWHLPLFWIDSSYQHGLGLWSPQFWFFILDKIPFTFMLTWIFNHTKRSTLSAVFFHFVMNLTGELVDLTLVAEGIYISSLWIITALILVVEQSEWFSVNPIQSKSGE